VKLNFLCPDNSQVSGGLKAGLGGYTIDVLTNHWPRIGSVTTGYIRQSLGHPRQA
jgi:hypothetical protein